MPIDFIYDTESSGEPIPIDAHFQVWPEYRVRVTEEPDLSIDAEISVKYDYLLDRGVVEHVIGLRRSMGAEVSGSTLRSLRIKDYVQRNELLAQWDQPGHGWRAAPLDVLVNAAKTQWDQPGVERARWAFRIYRAAQLAAQDPAKRVETSMAIPSRTATRWIASARDLGFFGPDGENFSW